MMGAILMTISDKNVYAADEAPPPPGALTLWYREPAKEWNEALPIGNGRLGAMVFGGVEREQLQFNEERR